VLPPASYLIRDHYLKSKFLESGIPRPKPTGDRAEHTNALGDRKIHFIRLARQRATLADLIFVDSLVTALLSYLR